MAGELRRNGWIVVAAAIIAAAIFTFKLSSDRSVVAPPESADLAATVSSGTVEGVAVQFPPTNKESLMEGLREHLSKRQLPKRRSLEQCVIDAQVIVVATALDSAPAPPNVPGDLPENFIRFRVTRVLKGKLAAQVITTRTPTAANEFIGHEWVILLSPEYMAGKHQFADCNWIKAEPEVKAILSKATE